MAHRVKFSKTHGSIDAKHKDLDRGLVEEIPIGTDGVGRFYPRLKGGLGWGAYIDASAE